MNTGRFRDASVSERQQQHASRGRVRSGCLTCRSRKVKCDEVRPACNNCTRLKRNCTYKPRKPHHSANNDTIVLSPQATNGQLTSALEPSSLSDPASVEQSVSQPLSSLLSSEHQNCVLDEILFLENITTTSADGNAYHPLQTLDNSTTHFTTHAENALRRENEISMTADDTESEVPSHSTLISRDIKLTTTMDILAAGEVSSQPSFSYFVKSVDCAPVTPYDSLNWHRMKIEVVEIALCNTAVASAIIAVSMLYKAQVYSLSLCRALALYKSAKIAYQKLLNDESHTFDVILTCTFLLCLFEFMHHEEHPILKEQGGQSQLFLNKLGFWTAQHDLLHSELSSRLVAWLRILHATTLRGGGAGLISDSVCDLFPRWTGGVPNLRTPSNHQSNASVQLFEVLSMPIFDFYLRLQVMSGEIAHLTHYHRSRTTGADQEEVVQQIFHLKTRIKTLWSKRSATQRQSPSVLRSHLAPQIANPLLELAGMTACAYHAEIIEMDRVLGDPVSKSSEARESRRQIREIVDGSLSTSSSSGASPKKKVESINPGYLRPLFMYAIECMNEEDNQWAVNRIRQIDHATYRSEFWAAFGKALSDAQLKKERRVTSKYFCTWYFGVEPPFL